MAAQDGARRWAVLRTLAGQLIVSRQMDTECALRHAFACGPASTMLARVAPYFL